MQNSCSLLHVFCLASSLNLTYTKCRMQMIMITMIIKRLRQIKAHYGFFSRVLLSATKYVSFVCVHICCTLYMIVHLYQLIIQSSTKFKWWYVIIALTTSFHCSWARVNEHTRSVKCLFLSLYIYCNNFPRLSLAFHMFIFHSRTLTHPSKSSASRALDWITERRWPAKTYRKYKYSRHIYIHNNDAEHIYVRFMNIHIQDIYRFNEPKILIIGNRCSYRKDLSLFDGIQFKIE